MTRALAIVAASIACLAVLVVRVCAEDNLNGDDSTHTIVVSGSGQVNAAPDTADLSFAIETHAQTAQAAASKNAAVAAKIVDALKAKVAGNGRVQTGGYSINPDYEQHNGIERPKIIGFSAQNTISVETSDLNDVGRLIDAGIVAGANRVNDLNFTLKDDTKARSDAITAASHDAQAQARALASSLGVKLGDVIKASTISEQRPVPVMMRAASFAASAPTPIEAGEITVPATVSLTYEIE